MEKRLGVYIHIPFCASKCGYCDFYSLAGCDDKMSAYEEAVIAHLQESDHAMAPYQIDSVYFGGGTPSYFGAKRICGIFRALKDMGRVRRDSEVTMEANPDSMRRDELKMLRREGVNRISIGMQSANSDILKLIGRRHNFRQVQMAVKAARDAGFDNLSLDLIYGLPSQSKADWVDTLSKAMELKPEHISCYGLKLEEGTPMFREYSGSPLIPDDDTQADMYLYAVETLDRYGYRQYEISNFAIPGYESRHNLKYWILDDYMGFGPGAASCVGSARYSYVKDLDKYISGVKDYDRIIDEFERIEPLERASEYIMLGMRTSKGITEDEYRSIYLSQWEPIEKLMEVFAARGWTKNTDGRWAFTPSGFLVSNQLIGALLDAQAVEKVQTNPWMQGALDDHEKQELPPDDDELFRSIFENSII
jgi:putative oxygen-independent coproporphyrinogen III oxidase